MTFAADPDIYHQQSNDMRGYAGRLVDVMNAARFASIDRGAFGTAAAFLAESAHGGMAALANTVAKIHEITEETSDVLRAIASDFRASEQERADRLRALTAALE